MSDNELKSTVNRWQFQVFPVMVSGKDSSHKLIVAGAIMGLQSDIEGEHLLLPQNRKTVHRRSIYPPTGAFLPAETP